MGVIYWESYTEFLYDTAAIIITAYATAEELDELLKVNRYYGLAA
jgi:hypothetical protein